MTERWPARDQLDRAGRRVASVQGALRATQDFEALDVEQIECRAILASYVHVVDVDAHRRIRSEERFRLAYATHEDLGGAASASVWPNLEVWNNLIELSDAPDLLSLKHISGERGNRDGHRLLGLLVTLRRDGDFLETLQHFLAFGGLLGWSDSCKCNQGNPDEGDHNLARPMSIRKSNHVISSNFLL
ncbi:MAG TPA: hypothetical protein PK159_04645 [Steroidobacteraceae bacterium]|nr:hypothetical protein [Steroidobacteraceae bacterium]